MVMEEILECHICKSNGLKNRISVEKKSVWAETEGGFYDEKGIWIDSVYRYRYQKWYRCSNNHLLGIKK